MGDTPAKSQRSKPPGLAPQGLEEDFQSSLERVQKLSPKPHQKAQLISVNMVPHYIYALVLAHPPTQMIRRLDGELKKVIRSIYHLPQCTANGLLYCKKKDGGLGVPRLETIVTSASLKSGIKFLNNEDPVVRAIIHEGNFKQRLENMAKGARISWPITSLKDIK
jgi:hypothetical protein